MCYDYYCTSCSDHETGSCTSCVDGYPHSNGGCTCVNDIYGRQAVRDDTLNPCCANGCNKCVDELYYLYCRSCSSGFYKQPQLHDPHGDFEVCMQDCPTGYTTGDNQVCSGSSELIIDYDLTYIERPFTNLAIAGVLDGSLGSVRSSEFKDTIPYKLRGAWSDGIDRGIWIPNLRLHHSFTVSLWVSADALSSDSVLFGKDKNIYTSAGDEDWFECGISSTGRLSTKFFLNGADAFADAAKTDENIINIDTWYFIAFSYYFTGIDTPIKIFRDNASLINYEANDLYIEDQLNYANTFLFMTTDKQANEAAAEPSKVFSGFIYWFQLWYKPVEANTSNLAEILGSQYQENCDVDGCTCSKCPLKPTARCLWTVERDEFRNTDCNSQECNEDGETHTCTIENGCVRSEDCNRCHDRLCSTCLNFDEGDVVCEECILNASK